MTRDEAQMKAVKILDEARRSGNSFVKLEAAILASLVDQVLELERFRTALAEVQRTES